MIKDLLTGVADLASGFGLWRSRPRLMALALLPALAVFVVMVAILIGLSTWLVSLVPGWTGFADGWPAWASGGLRFVIGLGIVLAVAVVFAVSYTAFTLAAGDPVYTRISRSTEELYGGHVPDHSVGWGVWIRDTLRLAGVAAVWGLGVGVLGLLPGIGTVVAAVAGFLGASWLQAVGLTTAMLERHGLDRHARVKLLRTRPWRVLGYGVGVQAMVMIPLGAVFVMPAAAAGATRLAHSLLGSRPDEASPD